MLEIKIEYIVDMQHQQYKHLSSQKSPCTTTTCGSNFQDKCIIKILTASNNKCLYMNNDI